MRKVTYMFWSLQGKLDLDEFLFNTIVLWLEFMYSLVVDSLKVHLI